MLEQLETLAIQAVTAVPSLGAIAEPEISFSGAVMRLEDQPTLLWEAVDLARSLVSQLKSPVLDGQSLTYGIG